MRWAIAITIWTAVSLALGGLYILAMRKIRGKDHWDRWMAHPDPYEDPVGDIPDTKHIRTHMVGERNE